MDIPIYDSSPMGHMRIDLPLGRERSIGAMKFNYRPLSPARSQGMEDDDKNVGGRLQLLHEVSGAFRPGVLTALVGVSGAGKTTLMDVLAGRKTGAISTLQRTALLIYIVAIASIQAPD
jgi:ATPase subunit of ABC transporter with duplicated ATPase domains